MQQLEHAELVENHWHVIDELFKREGSNSGNNQVGVHTSFQYEHEVVLNDFLHEVR